jgi:hypothetical protein
MSALNRLTNATSAVGDQVTGTSASGNDQQLKVIMAAVANRNKTAPWGNRVISQIVYDVSSSAGGPFMIYGYTEQPVIVQSVGIYLTRAKSTSTASTNYVDVRMYRGTSRSTSTILDIGAPNRTDVDISPTTSIRSIQGVDDGKFYPLAIQTPFIATGTYWAIRMTPPASASSLGWEEAHVTIQLAEHHRVS